MQQIQDILIYIYLMVFLDQLTALATIDLMFLAMKTSTFLTRPQCKISRYSDVVSLYQNHLPSGYILMNLFCAEFLIAYCMS